MGRAYHYDGRTDCGRGERWTMPTPDRSERTFGETVRARHRDPVAKRDRIQAAEAARVDRRIARTGGTETNPLAMPPDRVRPIEGLTSIAAAERVILECCLDSNGEPDYPRQTMLLRTLKGWGRDRSVTSDHRRKLIKFLKRWNRAHA